MILQREIELIDDLVKESPDHTIKDFIEIRDEIEKIESWKERRIILLNQLINDNQSIGIKRGEHI